MNKTEIYQEFFVESFKNYIKAEAEFKKTASLLFDLKCNYIEGKIRKRSFLIHNVKYWPVLINTHILSPSTSRLRITYLADPNFLRSKFRLTKKQTTLLAEYEDKVLKEHPLGYISQEPEDEYLINNHNDLFVDFHYLKNRIELREDITYHFTAEEIADDDFVRQRLYFDDKPLWLCEL